MAEVSLYRKYRPHNFDNLVGQDNIKTTLVNALKLNRVSHAYLFAGPRGTGKTSTARLLAKALNCTNLKDNYEPCNECDFCEDVNNGRLIDLIEIDAASNRGIDEVRDLKEKISFAPSRSKYKIYIIDEVHMMTKEAFNALLKTLEEPPDHAYFILATTEVHKIPETIISRCQRFDFRRITKKALMTRLSFIAQKEEIDADDNALELISRYVDGGLRDAIGLLEQLTVDKKLTMAHVQEILGISSGTLLDSLLECLIAKDTKESLKIVGELHSQGSDLRQFLHEFIDLIREKMLDSVHKEEFDTVALYMNMIEILQEAQVKVDPDIPQLPFEMAVIKITAPLSEFSTEISQTLPVKKSEPAKKPEKDLSEIHNKQENPKKEDIPKTEINDTADFPTHPLTIAYLKEKWPRITERVKTPSLKTSLRFSEPILVEGINVTLQFSSKFHKDKVMEHDSRAEIETIIKELFKSPVKVLTSMKELDIKSVVEDLPSEQENPPSNDMEDQALEIFGGEIVED